MTYNIIITPILQYTERIPVTYHVQRLYIGTMCFLSLTQHYGIHSDRQVAPPVIYSAHNWQVHSRAY